MKKIEAANCKGSCSPFESTPCYSSSCTCIPKSSYEGYCYAYPSVAVMKMVEEHPNLCQSHAECTKKGSGSFCALYPNHDIKYGWCFTSKSEARDFEIASKYKFTNDFFKMLANR